MSMVYSIFWIPWTFPCYNILLFSYFPIFAQFILSSFISSLWSISQFEKICQWTIFNPLSANPTRWSNTLKQFVGNMPTTCLNVFDHFMKLALKGLSNIILRFLGFTISIKSFNCFFPMQQDWPFKLISENTDTQASSQSLSAKLKFSPQYILKAAVANIHLSSITFFLRSLDWQW